MNLLTCTLLVFGLSFIAHAEEEQESPVEIFTTCIKTANSIETKRACSDACIQHAYNTSGRNYCGDSLNDIEKEEFESVYKDSVKEQEKIIRSSKETFEIEKAKEIISRLSAYKAALPEYIEAKCNIYGLAMLGGTAETALIFYCHADTYKEATAAISHYGLEE